MLISQKLSDENFTAFVLSFYQIDRIMGEKFTQNIQYLKE